jgi:SAM-dependent methyltransferase
LPTSNYWDKVSSDLPGGEPFDELLADHYRRVYTDLVNRWKTPGTSRLILKTDIYDESMCLRRSFASGITDTGDTMVGMDISPEFVRMAMESSRIPQPPPHHYVCCDVRRLPFAEAVFDLVISDSTLDHFERKQDIYTSVAELHRVMKPGGTLIISLDNKHNITEPFFRLWITLGLSPYYVGPTLSAVELKNSLEELGFTVPEETCIMHIPRYFGKVIAQIFRKMNRSDIVLKCLDWLDTLEHRRTKYLTGQFIAARALKK